MPHVRRTPLASKDLSEIAYFIGEQSQSRETVLRWLDSLESHCEIYSTRPELGEVFAALGPDVRRFAVGNYVVIYRPYQDGIELLRVVHGSRDLRAFRLLD